MKIRECRLGKINDIGFIDPDKVHEVTLDQFAEETEDIFLTCIRRQRSKKEILFPYNFK